MKGFFFFLDAAKCGVRVDVGKQFWVQGEGYLLLEVLHVFIARKNHLQHGDSGFQINCLSFVLGGMFFSPLSVFHPLPQLVELGSVCAGG